MNRIRGLAGVSVADDGSVTVSGSVSIDQAFEAWFAAGDLTSDARLLAALRERHERLNAGGLWLPVTLRAASLIPQQCLYGQSARGAAEYGFGRLSEEDRTALRGEVVRADSRPTDLPAMPGESLRLAPGQQQQQPIKLEKEKTMEKLTEKQIAFNAAVFARVKQARLEAGVSLVQLASVLGISKRAFCDRKRHGFSAIEEQKIKSRCGVSPGFLLPGQRTGDAAGVTASPATPTPAAPLVERVEALMRERLLRIVEIMTPEAVPAPMSLGNLLAYIETGVALFVARSAAVGVPPEAAAPPSSVEDELAAAISRLDHTRHAMSVGRGEYQSALDNVNRLSAAI